MDSTSGRKDKKSSRIAITTRLPRPQASVEGNPFNPDRRIRVYQERIAELNAKKPLKNGGYPTIPVTPSH
jgi:hypothetical protein